MTGPDAGDDDRPSRTAYVVGCSVRGPKHEAAGDPCQDASFGYELPGARFVLAVADGLGSASHSQYGAEAATRAVAGELRDAVVDAERLDREQLAEAMETAFAAARGAVADEADERGQPVSALNTTLLALTAGPFGVAGAAVGDGGVVRHHDGTHHLLVPREDVAYSNRTTPLQSDQWTASYRFGYHEAVDAATVFSDGLDPFVWDDRESVRETFFDQVVGHVRSTVDREDAQATLREFLDDEHFRRHSRDDKSVFVGVLLDESAARREPTTAEPVDGGPPAAACDERDGADGVDSAHSAEDGAGVDEEPDGREADATAEAEGSAGAATAEDGGPDGTATVGDGEAEGVGGTDDGATESESEDERRR
jgi:hypothetical protein